MEVGSESAGGWSEEKVGRNMVAAVRLSFTSVVGQLTMPTTFALLALKGLLKSEILSQGGFPLGLQVPFNSKVVIMPSSNPLL